MCMEIYAEAQLEETHIWKYWRLLRYDENVHEAIIFHRDCYELEIKTSILDVLLYELLI